jgi:hypothetical protein
MNKKRKILTIVALGIFAAIIGLHYVGFYPWLKLQPPTYKSPVVRGSGFTSHIEMQTVENNNIINDVRMPVFVLAVFYAGLFFILGPTETKNRPPAP